MKACMTIAEASKVPREPIAINNTYRFYSDCVECTSDNGVLIRQYSGQWVNVVKRTSEANPEIELQYKVRASNGDTFQAGAGELNGWIFETGQWVGPRIF
jgi:hypothetical protein